MLYAAELNRTTYNARVCSYYYCMRNETECKKYRMSKATGALLTKLDLPEGALDNVPCIRIFGRNTAEIENHRGVLEFSDSKVRLHTALGILSIAGTELRICCADKQTVVCTGEIASVEYENSR